MIKKINTYWLILILIIVIQLIAQPNIGKRYYYFIILLAVFFVNGGYKFVISGFKRNQNQTDIFSFKLIRNLDFSQFSLQMNNIAVVTFIYFIYIHTIVMANAIENPADSRIYEYIYRNQTYYMTLIETEALIFWKYASIALIPSSIVIRIINGLRKK